MHQPEIEQLPWSEQRKIDDPLFRAQIAYLFENSRFFRDKLRKHGLTPPPMSAGWITLRRFR
jgi:phenylacetate-CoA ligase